MYPLETLLLPMLAVTKIYAVFSQPMSLSDTEKVCGANFESELQNNFLCISLCHDSHRLKNDARTFVNTVQ
jgi:hypothetical protein